MVAFPLRSGYCIILMVHRRVASGLYLGCVWVTSGLRLGLMIFIIFLPADPLVLPFSMVARYVSSSEMIEVLSNHTFGLPIHRKSLFRCLEMAYTKNTVRIDIFHLLLRVALCRVAANECEFYCGTRFFFDVSG